MDNKVNKDRVLYDYSGVPPDAKKEGLFCLYHIKAKSKYTPRLDKIPYTRYGNRADSGNRSDFGSFEEVHAVYEKGKYDGVGMGNFLYCMVDVDDCFLDGELDERGRDIMHPRKLYAMKFAVIASFFAGILDVVFAYQKLFDWNNFVCNMLYEVIPFTEYKMSWVPIALFFMVIGYLCYADKEILKQ